MKANLVRLGLETYTAYLKSDLWGSIRLRVMQRDGFKCVCCGEKARCVHHRSYDFSVLAGSKDEMLVSLCNDCHEFVEFDDAGKKILTNEPAIKEFRLAELFRINNGLVRPDKKRSGRRGNSSIRLDAIAGVRAIFPNLCGRKITGKHWDAACAAAGIENVRWVSRRKGARISQDYEHAMREAIEVLNNSEPKDFVEPPKESSSQKKKKKSLRKMNAQELLGWKKETYGTSSKERDAKLARHRSTLSKDFSDPMAFVGKHLLSHAPKPALVPVGKEVHDLRGKAVMAVRRILKRIFKKYVKKLTGEHWEDACKFIGRPDLSMFWIEKGERFVEESRLKGFAEAVDILMWHVARQKGWVA